METVNVEEGGGGWWDAFNSGFGGLTDSLADLIRLDKLLDDGDESPNQTAVPNTQPDVTSGATSAGPFNGFSGIPLWALMLIVAIVIVLLLVMFIKLF